MFWVKQQKVCFKSCMLAYLKYLGYLILISVLQCLPVFQHSTVLYSAYLAYTVVLLQSFTTFKRVLSLLNSLFRNR